MTMKKPPEVLGAGRIADPKLRMTWHLTFGDRNYPARSKTLCGMKFLCDGVWFTMVPLPSEKHAINCDGCRRAFTKLLQAEGMEQKEAKREKHAVKETCPFCGWHYSDLKRQQHMGEQWWVQCCNCQARGPRCDNKKDAVQGWNDGVERT